MNYVITALIAISSLLGGYIVHEQSTPNVGASQSISSLTELTSLSHNDVLPITEVNGLTTKKVKWGTATSSMKAVFDPLYSPIFSTSAGLAGLLSDETGSSGGFVRAGSPTITSPVISSLSSLSVGSDATGDIYYRNGSGNFVRLAMPSGSGYYLTGSSTLSIPQWDNNILTNPYNAAMVFNATTTFNGSALGTVSPYGTGADGDVTISGSVTLTRDMYYRNLTLSNGSTLNNGGYIIFVSGTLTQTGTGKIANNTAGNASGSTGGTAATGVTIPVGIAGVNGGATTAAGANGNAAANSVGSDGVTPTGTAGAGGNTQAGGDYGCNTFGSTGTAGVTSTPRILGDYQIVRSLGLFVNGTYVRLTGHAGNPSAQGGGKGNFYSGGTCNNGGASGGSGANGGWVVVFAKNIVVNAGVTMIESIPGNGGNGTNGSNGDSSYNGYGEGGGGAGALGLGGNGGTAVVVYSTKSGAITYNLPAGTNGTAGTAGTGFSATYPGYDGAASTFTGTPIVGQSFELNF